APAFITSADFLNEQVYPASWLLEEANKLSVFEYSTDVQVKRTLEKPIKNPTRDSLKHFEKKTEDRISGDK
ncbi:1962_t:CDS:2, partial [Ambispora leptoticha]